MGYIRDNEGYYISQGYSPGNADRQVKIDSINIDPGFCNPIKAKLYEEAEKEAKKETKDE